MGIEKELEKLSRKLADNEKPKLCKNCKWVRRDRLMAILSFGFGDWNWARCASPKTRNSQQENTALVSGNSRGSSYCSIERGNWVTLEVCGPDGKFYEPKSVRG